LKASTGDIEKQTFSRPAEEETLTILGESDNWRRGNKASVVAFTP